MNRLFASTVLTFSLCFAAYIPVNAQSLPSEVIEPYKAYLAAEEAGKNKAMEKAAKTAYQAAEKHLGDHKTTGDLAQNYADAMQPTIGLQRAEFQPTEKIALYLRSAELAKFHSSEDALDFELERFIKAAETNHLNATNTLGREGLDEARKLIDANKLSGSTYDGEVLALEAKRLLFDDKKHFSLITVDKAIAVLESPTDRIPSAYLPIARLHKATLMKRDNDILGAALAYQDVMQNAEKMVPNTHPMVRSASTSWLAARHELEQAGRLKEAKLAGLCDCGPLAEGKSKFVPMLRIPPTVPSRFLQGNHSGYVMVKFDVTDDGRPENIEITNSTDRRLNNATIDSVEKWVFSKKTIHEDSLARKGVANKVNFMVMDEHGKVLPFPS